MVTIVYCCMYLIELLQQFLLLSEAASIVNRCPIKEVNETSQVRKELCLLVFVIVVVIGICLLFIIIVYCCLCYII